MITGALAQCNRPRSLLFPPLDDFPHAMLSDYQDLVDDLVRDDSARITDDERNIAIDLAVKRYNKDRPRTKVQDLDPTSATKLPLPSAWETDFSALRSLDVKGKLLF